MKQPVRFPLLLALLSLQLCFSACNVSNTIPVTSGDAETTAEPSEEVTSEENTAEADETTEGDTTEEETTAEVIIEEEPSVKELYSHKWYYSNADFFDYQLTYLPDDEDFEKLQEGMTIAEVIEIVGRPHGIIDNNSRPLYWVTTGNNRYTLWIRYPQDENGKHLKTYSIFEEFALSTYHGYDKLKIKEPKPYTSSFTDLLEDPRYKKLPSHENIINIPAGTTFQEIITLYGKPQYYGQFTILGIGTRQFWVFYTAEGIEVGVKFDIPIGEDSFENGYVDFVMDLGPQNYIPESNTSETTTESP